MTEAQIRAAVFAAAEAQAAPTWAVFLQVQIESGFNPAAVSDVGAIGPCQILPATGANPGFGLAPVTQAQLLDPTQATTFLCQYLEALRNDPNVGAGRWSTAFLKYNVGPFGDINNASASYKALATHVAAVEGEPAPFVS